MKSKAIAIFNKNKIGNPKQQKSHDIRIVQEHFCQMQRRNFVNKVRKNPYST